MQNIEKSIPSTLIDNRLVRANASLTTLVLALALVSPRSLCLALLGLQAVAFALSVWAPKLSPYSLVSKRLFLVNLFKKGEGEHRKPIRFSQQVGLLFVLPAFLLLSLNLTGGRTLIAFCLWASALNAFLGLCIACKIYPRLQLIQYRLRSLFHLQIR